MRLVDLFSSNITSSQQILIWIFISVFKSLAGIGAGTFASKLMSLSATTGYGGSLIGFLQSAGAAGMGAASILSGAAAACGATFFGKKDKEN